MKKQIIRVSNDHDAFVASVDKLKSHLTNKVKTFQSGCLKQHKASWEAFTSDSEVLSTASGLPVEFETTPHLPQRPNRFAKAEQQIINQGIEKLMRKVVIKKPTHEEGEIISPIFLRNKPDGTFRLILNLKEANKHIDSIHFKMETINSILKLVRPNCYMASVDIKDAYYSIPVSEHDQKYPKFMFDGQLYAFTCLPNGLCSEPSKFAKLLKAPLATLREAGHILGGYIVDIFNMGLTYDECMRNVIDTVNLLDSLGFTIHPEKSKFIPSQVLIFPGFVINSVTMKVCLTDVRKVAIKETCIMLVRKGSPTIREVARVIGLMTASFPGVKYGSLHFRDLERCKSRAVKESKGSYDCTMKLDGLALCDVQWWIDNIDRSDNEINQDPPSLTMTTDASTFGWGGGGQP